MRIGKTHTSFSLGEGQLFLTCRQSLRRKNLDAYVTLTGQVSHDEVATYLSNGDVGVAPDPKNAMNDNSTMIKILEYMAFACQWCSST